MSATALPLHQLRDLPFESFKEKLFDHWYPHIYEVLKKLELQAALLIENYSLEGFDTYIKKISTEFDNLYSKEKLVLYPFLAKLGHENKRAENCSPFKNVKVHHTAMLNAAQSAADYLQNIFATDNNIEQISAVNTLLQDFIATAEELQWIKDSGYYIRFKNCAGCGTANASIA
jgi:hypothetical protein